MNNKNVRTLLFATAAVLGFIGFRFVTQAGQGLDAIQNDGYGGSGGAMILLSGIIIGLLIERKHR